MKTQVRYTINLACNTTDGINLKKQVIQHNFERKIYATQLVHKKLYNTLDVHKYSQQLMHVS